MDHKEDFDSGRLATTSGEPPKHFGAPAPDPDVNPQTGQHGSYWVLSEAERAKGFIRPVRRSYRHVGRALCMKPAPHHPDGRDEKGQRWLCCLSPHDGPCKGWGLEEDVLRTSRGCQTVTTMGVALAETYAREPGFYGATMCVGCRTHLPVGALGEFVWEGTSERVGT